LSPISFQDRLSCQWLHRFIYPSYRALNRNSTKPHRRPILSSWSQSICRGRGRAPKPCPEQAIYFFLLGVQVQVDLFLVPSLSQSSHLVMHIYIKTMIVSRLHKCPLIFFNEILYKSQKSSNFFCEDRIG
jgi:hypothetical protein